MSRERGLCYIVHEVKDLFSFSEQIVRRSQEWFVLFERLIHELPIPNKHDLNMQNANGYWLYESASNKPQNIAIKLIFTATVHNLNILPI